MIALWHLLKYGNIDLRTDEDLVYYEDRISKWERKVILFNEKLKDNWIGI